MARKPPTRAEFALFDVLYEDDSQRSKPGVSHKQKETSFAGIRP
jgi:hypothetical protein